MMEVLPQFLYYATNQQDMEKIIAGEMAASGVLYPEETIAWTIAQQWEEPVVLKYTHGSWAMDAGDGNWCCDNAPRADLVKILRHHVKAEITSFMSDLIDSYAELDFYQLVNRANGLNHEIAEMKSCSDPLSGDTEAYLKLSIERSLLFMLSRYRSKEMEFLCPGCGRLCDIEEHYCRKCGRVFYK